MNTTKVDTSIGVFEIFKPKAGVRNRALAKAETDSGGMKQTVLMMELLPKCIHKRPESCDADVPIDQILDSLEIEDYDKMFISLSKLIDVPEESVKKK
jgi:hypothetical protein